jgi:hypothetical protein
MLVYPQLPTGALAQFPAQKRRQMRTLVNTAADGTVIKLADPGAAIVEWQLKYAALSDAELATLLQFFAAAEGTLNNFTFVDPTANLLAWSNEFSNAVWDAAPFLSLASQRRSNGRKQRVASDELRRGAAGLIANSDGAGRICVLPERVRKGPPRRERSRCYSEAIATSEPRSRLAAVCLHRNRGSDSLVDDVRNRVGAGRGSRYIRLASGAAG